MSFSAFLTGTVLASSAALGGLLAMPNKQLRRQQLAIVAGAVGLAAAGFVGGWALAS